MAGNCCSPAAGVAATSLGIVVGAGPGRMEFDSRAATALLCAIRTKSPRMKDVARREHAERRSTLIPTSLLGTSISGSGFLTSFQAAASAAARVFSYGCMVEIRRPGCYPPSSLGMKKILKPSRIGWYYAVLWSAPSPWSLLRCASSALFLKTDFGD